MPPSCPAFDLFAALLSPFEKPLFLYNDVVPSMLSSHVRSRLGYALLSGLKAMASSFARTLYVLWLQTTGLMFGVFTVLGGSNVVRLYRQHAWRGDPRRFWITVGFTVVCLGFTIVSFWKAQRRQRA